ncbi:MAG: monovalent cation/H(+) antiporter subunit G [Clostridia bacterium]
MEWIRFIIASIFICAGLLFLIVEMFGVFKFKYVLNRMQAAAMGDTLGISLCLIGLIIISGLSLITFKFVLTILVLWVASPVASHLISRLEVLTYEEEEKQWEDINDDNI